MNDIDLDGHIRYEGLALPSGEHVFTLDPDGHAHTLEVYIAEGSDSLKHLLSRHEQQIDASLKVNE